MPDGTAWLTPTSWLVTYSVEPKPSTILVARCKCHYFLSDEI